MSGYDDRGFEIEPCRVTVVKHGPLTAEQAFALYRITDVDGIDRALEAVIKTPSITNHPFGYIRIGGPDLDVSMQFIEATGSLEQHLLHEDEDENGTVGRFPDLVLVTCRLRGNYRNQFFGWAHLHRVPYIDLHGETAYRSVHHGRLDS